MAYATETLESVMHELEMLGTSQNRKVYARHGVGLNQFGVSYADLKRIARRIKTDQQLAEALWSTKNHDARVLATMIVDPPQLTSRILDIWAEDLDNYVITDAFSALCGKTQMARRKLELWCAASDEWHGQAGWNLVAILAMAEGELSDEECGKLLAVIERTIHTRLNRVRHAMNGALIAIGLRNSKMRAAAIDAARRIGKVDVDHGETGCKTPDAAQYIKTASEHYRARAAKKGARAKAKAATNGKATSSPRQKTVKRTTAVKSAEKKRSSGRTKSAKTATVAARRKSAGKSVAVKSGGKSARKAGAKRPARASTK
jgi:3-methyladenine DNA glycosylase AlkD